MRHTKHHHPPSSTTQTLSTHTWHATANLRQRCDYLHHHGTSLRNMYDQSRDPLGIPILPASHVLPSFSQFVRPCRPAPSFVPLARDALLPAPRSASAMYTYIFPERAPLEMTYDVPFVCDPRQRGTSPFRSSFASCTYGLRGAKHTTQRRSNSAIPNSSHVMRNALHGPAIPCIGINTGGRRGCSSPAFLPTCSGTLNRQMLPVRRPPLSRSECRRPVSESCARL
jgi:hypothetical protein